MAYQTLYLRWRPANFETLVGQQPVKQALMNALETGRIAHAYLFTGPRGTGKTTTARIFAKALNCEKGATAHPCGTCTNCTQIAAGNSMDVLELDAASNRGVDDIKSLNKNADFAPVNCRYKVYIIDEAHMLTTEACNALLKTLEEPPDHVVFILATTEPHKILATIHSRCQRFDFHPISQKEIVEHLAMVAEGSGIKAEPEALELIAAASEGGMRDALSLLEQCSVMAEAVAAETVRSVRGIIGREILRKLVAALGNHQVVPALEIFDSLLLQGKDINQILLELADYLRALLLYKEAKEYMTIYVTDTPQELEGLAGLYTSERILASQSILHQATQELRFTARGRITAEMCLYDLCKLEGDSLLELRARVSQLEQTVAQLQLGVALAPQAAVAAPVAAVPTTAAVPPTTAQAPQAAPAATRPAPAKPAAAPRAAKPASPAPAAPAAQAAPTTGFTAYSGDWATGDELWHKALGLLKQEKKNAIASCANNGYVLAFENNVLTVGFKGGFLRDRLSKDDYRAVVEEALLRLSRLPIRLSCVVDNGLQTGDRVPATGAQVPEATREGAKPKAAPSPAAAPVTAAAVNSSTQKALDTLGGTIVKA